MSILCIYNGRVVPNAASCRLALDCASCTIASYVMSAHPRTSKYLPYVSKYTTKTDHANLHFKNLCAWSDDRTVACWKYTIQNHYAGVIMNCILLTSNQPVATPSVVTLNCILLTANVPVVTPSVVVFEM